MQILICRMDYNTSKHTNVLIKCVIYYKLIKCLLRNALILGLISF